MTHETIIYSFDDGIARLTLNRPKQLNSFTLRMHHEVAQVLDQLTAEPARVLVLTGAGRGFCAGQDLGERKVEEGEIDLGSNIEAHYNPLIRKLTSLACPVVCGINGVAAGAGLSIALACDITLARRSAKFVPAFSAIGLMPDAGGTWHLPQVVGLPRALGFVLGGEPILAEMAEAWGMIWKAVDDEHFDAELEALVQRLAKAPTRGLAAAKLAIRSAATRSLSQQLDLERDLQRQCGLTDDYREGVTAFKARRTPSFKGR